MLIDWFTVCAQALNFLVLVWLMKRFLYKPILNAIDARVKLVAAEVADAGIKQLEAIKQRDEFQHKKDEFDLQRDGLMIAVKNEAKVESERLLKEAQSAADKLASVRRESLTNSAQSLSLAIAKRTQTEVFAVTRRVLSDMAATNLEESIVNVFIRRFGEMDNEAKQRFGDALKLNNSPALVRSSFDLPEEQRTAICTMLNTAFSAEIGVQFEIAPDLISGIELSANGQKMAWSVSDYLNSLEQGVGELLRGPDAASARTGQESK